MARYGVSLIRFWRQFACLRQLYTRVSLAVPDQADKYREVACVIIHLPGLSAMWRTGHAPAWSGRIDRCCNPLHITGSRIDDWRQIAFSPKNTCHVSVTDVPSAPTKQRYRKLTCWPNETAVESSHGVDLANGVPRRTNSKKATNSGSPGHKNLPTSISIPVTYLEAILKLHSTFPPFRVLRCSRL
jgi:hypothetical protein